MIRVRCILLAAAICFLAGAAHADDIATILEDYEQFTLAHDPHRAGQLGDLEAAGRWPDVSPAADKARAAALRAFRSRLGALDRAALAGADRLNADLLELRLDTDIEQYAFDTARIPFYAGAGFFTAPVYIGGATRLRSAAEAEAYLKKMERLADYYDAHIANMRRGIETGFTQPKLVATAAARKTKAQSLSPVADHPLLAPFASLPAHMGEKEKAQLRARALRAVERKVRPAEKRLAAFFESEYLPAARESLAASDLPNGRAYYEAEARWNTTTTLTPDEIFDIGVAEIARIRKAMDAVIAETGFDGSFAEFQQYLRDDPQFYVDTREALLEKASRIAKRIDDKLPEYFGTLPRLSYGVRAVPEEIEQGYTSGRYFPGSPERGVAGGLMINTSELDQRPLFELPALAAHEGAPGHHLQIALAQEQENAPDFRRSDGVTAFVEGWALYSEQLVGEMGIYRTPYEWFGQLSMEMWRACRLVVDVGLHWKGWTRDEAVACFTENSALSDANIQSEVDRYIADPGQALAYKIGELKITELRRRAQSALGDRFDVRAFHDLILTAGPMPLSIVERRVEEWIAQGGEAAAQ